MFFYNLLAVFGKPTTFLCLLVCLGCAAVIFFRKIKLTPFTQHAVIATLLWLFVPIFVYTIAGVKFRWYVYSGLYTLPTLTMILLLTVAKAGSLKKTLIASVGVFAAGLIAMSVINVVYIATIEFHQTVQGFIIESTDRDLDDGKHAYILYAENRLHRLDARRHADRPVVRRPDLRGRRFGRVFRGRRRTACCLSHAPITRSSSKSWMGQEIIFYEDYYCVAFEKF